MRKILLILFAAAMFSCDFIKEGTVVKKEVEPERYYTQSVPHFIKVGKYTTVYYTYHSMYDDPDYKVEIEGYNKKHKLQDRWIYVDQDMYDTIRVGDWYCIDNRCHISPNPDIRKDEP